jgi:hypothetical protein
MRRILVLQLIVILRGTQACPEIGCASMRSCRASPATEIGP